MNWDICIMVVDDENAMRESLAGWLSKEGYRTLTAGSGPAALALQAEKACDLLLVDIKMQGMDGLEYLQEDVGAQRGGQRVPRRVNEEKPADPSQPEGRLSRKSLCSGSSTRHRPPWGDG